MTPTPSSSTPPPSSLSPSALASLARRRVSGVVETFDDPRGIGTLRSVDGDEIFFHCTAIADQSRTIEVGAVVTFAVVPGHLGRWEGADITPEPGQH